MSHRPFRRGSDGVVWNDRGGEDEGVFDDAVLDGGHLPLKCAKVGEPTLVALIGGEHSDA
jgi:hypothetical protein